MATKKLYFRNGSNGTPVAGSWTLSETIGGATEDTTTTHTGNGTANAVQLIKPGASQGATAVTTNDVTTPIAAGRQFGWFSDQAYTGQFDAGTWNFQHEHDDNRTNINGNPIVNVYKCSTKDFTGTFTFLFTITTGQDWWTGATATANFTTGAQSVVLMNGEFLFVQVLCKEPTTGTGFAHHFHTEGSVDANVSRITTSNFSVPIVDNDEVPVYIAPRPPFSVVTVIQGTAAPSAGLPYCIDEDYFSAIPSPPTVVNFIGTHLFEQNERLATTAAFLVDDDGYFRPPSMRIIAPLINVVMDTDELGSPTTFTQLVSGALGFIGIPLRTTNKFPSAALSPSGTLSIQSQTTIFGQILFRGIKGSPSIGLLSIQTDTHIGGAVDFFGQPVRQINKSDSGALSFTGQPTKQTTKAASGILSFIGSLISSRVFLKALAGALSFAGIQTRKTLRSFSAALSFTGQPTKQTTRAASGAVSFAGQPTKQTTKAASGALSFSGAVIRNVLKLIAGALSFSGIQTRQVAKSTSGAVSFSGQPTKQTTKAASGILSFIGTVAIVKVFLRSVGGALSFAGIQLRTTLKQASGAVSPSGAQTRMTLKNDAGAVSFAGQDTKQTIKAASGALSFVGTQARSILKSISGTLPLAGSLIRAIRKNTAGAMSFTGQPTKQTTRAASGAVSFAGQDTKMAGKAATGALSFAGTIRRLINKRVTGILSMTATLLPRFVVIGTTFFLTIAGALSFLGKVRSARGPGSGIRAKDVNSLPTTGKIQNSPDTTGVSGAQATQGKSGNTPVKADDVTNKRTTQ